MSRIILLTGASGTLGRWLAPNLAAKGYRLRLSDIVDFPGPLPEGTEFIRADLTDGRAVTEIVDGTSVILHFGGIVIERPWQEIVGPNIIGTTHIYEAARKSRQRVIFASSNHTIGFYEQGRVLGGEVPFRPDGYYAVSKVYGEMLGRMMWDKHGVESVHLRIGTMLPAPTEERHLSTWLSPPDLLRLVTASIEAENIGCAMVWGISDNRNRWWQNDDSARIGYAPQDDAARFQPLPATTDPVAQRFQGGSFCAVNYSRDDDDA